MTIFSPFGYSGMNGLGDIHLDGEIQTVDANGIVGWAADTGTTGPDWNITGPKKSVDILIDGVYYTSLLANVFNQGAATNMNYGQVGFYMPIPQQFKDGYTHTVSGNISGTSVQLRGGGSFKIGTPVVPPTEISTVVSPTPVPQAQAANATTASGDTSTTSASTLDSFTNLFSGGGVQIGGYTIPTLALVGGGLLLAYMMMSGGSRRRF